MRERRPTGYSPSGFNWPTGYRHPVENEQRLPVLSSGGCWCGGPNRHDWPGKDEGKPHPRVYWDERDYPGE